MDGEDWFAYSVAIQSEERALEETRTSSMDPVKAQQDVTVGMPPILNSAVLIAGVPGRGMAFEINAPSR